MKLLLSAPRAASHPHCMMGYILSLPKHQKLCNTQPPTEFMGGDKKEHRGGFNGPQIQNRAEPGHVCFSGNHKTPPCRKSAAAEQWPVYQPDPRVLLRQGFSTKQKLLINMIKISALIMILAKKWQENHPVPAWSSISCGQTGPCCVPSHAVLTGSSQSGRVSYMTGSSKHIS